MRTRRGKGNEMDEFTIGLVIALVVFGILFIFRARSNPLEIPYQAMNKNNTDPYGSVSGCAWSIVSGIIVLVIALIVLVLADKFFDLIEKGLIDVPISVP